MNFIGHIRAAYEVQRLAGVASPENLAAIVERAAWHVNHANGIVAHSWSGDPVRNQANELRAIILRAARARLERLALSTGTYEAYQRQWTLWLHWRAPGRAPEVVGVPGFNIHWGYDK